MKLKGTTRVLQLGSQHAVIMLSTEKDSAPIISVRNKVPNGKKILLAKGNLTPSADTQYEHLYFTSDNEITESDWYIDNTNAVRQSVTSDKNYWSRRKDYKKIVLLQIQT